MKRHAVWLLALLGLWAAPGIAVAQGNGIYVGLGGGAILPLDSDISGTGISTSADLDAGWRGIGIVGYRFASGIRTEFEPGYRAADVDSLTGSSAGSGEVGVVSAMGNAVYAFGNESSFTPYLGLGIGLAAVEFDDLQPVGGSVLDDSDTVIAYQGIVGLDYRLSERVQLFTDYRYFATADAGLSTRANVSVDSEYAARRSAVIVCGPETGDGGGTRAAADDTKADTCACCAKSGSSTAAAGCRDTSHLHRVLRLGQGGYQARSIGDPHASGGQRRTYASNAHPGDGSRRPFRFRPVQYGTIPSARGGGAR